MFEYVKEFLKMNDVEYKENASLSAMSPIRIGGSARIIAYPDSALKYIQVLRFLKAVKIKYRVLGRFSNVLVNDIGYDGVIVKTDRLNKWYVDLDSLYAYAGANTVSISAELCKLGLSGFEELSGIPGSLGGAIYGNAGAFGREISDILTEVTFYSQSDDCVYTASVREFDFSYRYSAFKKNHGHIISARFDIVPSDASSVAARMREVKQVRLNTQPISHPSLGSTFKRPNGNIPAAKMIDECGLKGYRIGGAEVSKKHAGFIINVGGATAKDYIMLSDSVSKRVHKEFGVILEREVELL